MAMAACALLAAAGLMLGSATPPPEVTCTRGDLQCHDQDLSMLQTRTEARGKRLPLSRAKVLNPHLAARNPLLDEAVQGVSLLRTGADPAEQRYDWVVVMDGAHHLASKHLCNIVTLCFGFADFHPFGGVPIFTVRATETELDWLLKDMIGEVRFIEPNAATYEVADYPGNPDDGRLRWVELESQRHLDEFAAGAPHLTSVDSYTVPSWGLDAIDDFGDLDNSFRAPGDAGAGVSVYLLDTGVRETHEQLGGRAYRAAQMLGRGVEDCGAADALPDCATDRRGHGTHAAGTIAGSLLGVAGGAVIKAVKVLGDHGTGDLFWTVQALEWVLEDAVGPAVIHLGFQANGRFRFVKEAVDLVVRRGLPVVVPAGNNAEAACHWTPAFIPSALCVGAFDKSGKMAGYVQKGQRYWASNFGRCVDVLAPGTGLLSIAHDTDTGTVLVSGTNAAAAHATGTVAAMLQLEPGASPQAILEYTALNATVGRLADAAGGTPNLMLHMPIRYALTRDTAFSRVPPGAHCRSRETPVQAGSQEECLDACMAAHLCNWVSFRDGPDGGACNLYRSCGRFLMTPGQDFTTWRKAPAHELAGSSTPLEHVSMH